MPVTFTTLMSIRNDKCEGPHQSIFMSKTDTSLIGKICQLSQDLICNPLCLNKLYIDINLKGEYKLLVKVKSLNPWSAHKVIYIYRNFELFLRQIATDAYLNSG